MNNGATHGATLAAAQKSRRDKLGLALAGGGFRASLFHLGVLTRLAELDILRDVEVISTVSGGSIVGALYVLILKRYMDANGTLTRAAYEAVVRETRTSLIAGIQKNLRTRLFMNPLGTLRVMLTHHSLGKRMARLYERYIYAAAVARLPNQKTKLGRPGRIPLLEVRFDPGGGGVPGGLENFNQRATSKIPSLILNSTALNSGMPFRFSSIEIGDPHLGYFRWDETEDQLLPRKRLLELSAVELQESIVQAGTNPISISGVTYPRKTVEYVGWWRSQRGPSPTAVPGPLKGQRDVPGALSNCSLGMLRRAKLAAWYLTIGKHRTPPVTGGVPVQVHQSCLAAIINDIDPKLTLVLREHPAELMELIIELYYLRSAETMSDRIRDHWQNLSLGDAVGASACFPPVFPPYIELGFYDDLTVTRLGLTDGGVYDNLGITSLLDEECTHIIASDTGGLFDLLPQSPSGRLGMSSRIVSILMNAVGTLQGKDLNNRFKVSSAMGAISAPVPSIQQLQVQYDVRCLALFRINSLPVQWPGLSDDSPNLLANIRTDLDAFGDVEIAALVNQGYYTADKVVTNCFQIPPAPTTQPPCSWAAPSAWAVRILQVGSGRVFRSLLLGSPASWVFTFVIFVAALIFTRQMRFNVAQVCQRLGLRALHGMEMPLSWIGIHWTRIQIPVAAFLLIVFVAMVGVLILPRMVRVFRHRSAVPARKVLTTAKWARSLVGNMLWLLGGTPLWIAIGAAIVSWISHAFFCLPFLYASRNIKTEDAAANQATSAQAG